MRAITLLVMDNFCILVGSFDAYWDYFQSLVVILVVWEVGCPLANTIGIFKSWDLLAESWFFLGGGF